MRVFRPFLAALVAVPAILAQNAALKAFGCKPGSPMVRPEAERCDVW